jgi:hypothetical protein
MKKKLFIALIILIVIISSLFLKIKINKNKLNKITNSINNYINLITNKKIQDGDYNITQEGLYNEFTNIKIDSEEKISGTLYILDNKIINGCINIDNYGINIEENEIKNTEKIKCDYIELKNEEETLEEYIENYIELVKTLEIKESNTYDINTINEQMIYLDEFPSEGWIKLEYNEIDGITIKEYSIKYRNKAYSFDGKEKRISNEIGGLDE